MVFIFDFYKNTESFGAIKPSQFSRSYDDVKMYSLIFSAVSFSGVKKKASIFHRATPVPRIKPFRDVARRKGDGHNIRFFFSYDFVVRRRQAFWPRDYGPTRTNYPHRNTSGPPPVRCDPADPPIDPRVRYLQNRNRRTG